MKIRIESTQTLMSLIQALSYAIVGIGGGGNGLTFRRFCAFLLIKTFEYRPRTEPRPLALILISSTPDVVSFARKFS